MKQRQGTFRVRCGMVWLKGVAHSFWMRDLLRLAHRERSDDLVMANGRSEASPRHLFASLMTGGFSRNLPPRRRVVVRVAGGNLKNFVHHVALLVDFAFQLDLALVELSDRVDLVLEFGD